MGETTIISLFWSSYRLFKEVAINISPLRGFFSF